MDLTALSSATLISLIATLLFLLVVKAWAAFATSSGQSRFPHSIMLEAAQRYRDELSRRGREQSIYLVSTLVLTVVFCIAYILRPERLFSELPKWQHVVVIVVLGLALGSLAYRLVTIVIARRDLTFKLDAAMAVGHALQKLTANKNRVFHDVRTAAGTIDNVVVGLHGVYAVSVIARRPPKDNRARLKGDQLMFANKESVSVQRCGTISTRLAKEIGKVSDSEIKVRSVIAVPGWEIDSQASSDFLLVNERNIAMLTGWRDQSDYLMNEDVEAIQQLLTERCTRFA